MMGEALRTTLQTLQDALRGFSPPPTLWSWLAWGLLALAALLLVALLRRRQARKSRGPQLFISRGEISQVENSALEQLSLKLSNLNDYPVQLLELAVKTERMPTPMSIDAVELLPPHQAIELEAELPHDIVGDHGVVFAYSYVPQQRGTLYRLQAAFVWEPWNKRYKISPLGQSVRPVRSLSSSQLDAVRKQAWLERNPHLGRGPAPRPTEAEPQKDASEKDREEKRPVWEFPREF